MKKLFFFAAALFAAVSFSACSDDDDNINPNQIIGTWQITLDEGWAIYSDGSRDDWSDTYPDASDGNYYWTYTFKEDGICVQESHADYHNPGDDYTDEYNYSISGNTLTMKGKTDSELTFTGTIKELTSNKLVLFSNGENADEKFEQTETYIKVK